MNKLKAYSDKLIILSIGAQNSDMSTFKLESENKKIISTLFRKAETIFLRGDYTQNLLISNDINTSNCVSLGCPSILLHHIDTSIIIKKIAKLKCSQKYNVAMFIPRPGQTRFILEKLLTFSSGPRCYTIIQDHPEFYSFAQKLKSKIFCIKDFPNYKAILKNQKKIILF